MGTMTTRNRIILLCAIVLVPLLLLGCLDDGGEWGEWQSEVLERQRQEGQPGNVATVEAERSER